MSFEHRYGLRRRLKEGLSEPLLMAGIQIPSPDTVEMAGFAGFDIVLIDAEHGSLSARDIQDMIRAADAVQMPAIVRVPSASPDNILRALDAGAAGIVAPHANNAADAAAAIREGRFPPLGDRGSGLYTRAFRFTLDSGTHVFKEANEGVTLGVQIESVAGVENAEAIMRTPGVDFILVGPSDMSTDRGTYQQDEDPWVRQAVKDLGALGQRLGVTMMTRAATLDFTREYFGYGYRVLTVGLPALLAKTSADWVRQTRAAAMEVSV
jgi:4-hydroxy-2-oxoheptanedioate aldolase